MKQKQTEKKNNQLHELRAKSRVKHAMLQGLIHLMAEVDVQPQIQLHKRGENDLSYIAHTVMQSIH